MTDNTNNLVTLAGSQKQIDWAEDIRAAAIKGVDDAVTTIDDRKDMIPADQYPKVVSGARMLRDRLATQPRAAWWIDCMQSLDGGYIIAVLKEGGESAIGIVLSIAIDGVGGPRADGIRDAARKIGIID